MQCSFKEENVLEGGFYRSSTCVNRAEIMLVNDPCYGLCYRCAYKKLQAELEKSKNALEEIAKKASHKNHKK